MFSLPYILVTDRGLGDCCGFEGFAPAPFRGKLRAKNSQAGTGFNNVDLSAAKAYGLWVPFFSREWAKDAGTT